jgi:hypothetical protein
MRRTFVALALAAAAVFLAPGPAAASASTPDQSCGALRLTGSLPAPPAGKAVRQSVTIGPDCQVITGPAKVVAASPAARTAAAAPFHTYSQMYDCCGIVMTALYTDSTATTAGGQVTSSSSTRSTHNNREPWNAGWSLVSATGSGGCAGACPAAEYNHHAEFSYQGIFDATGNWYYNVHDSKVVLNGDGTARCEQSVTLRHSFIGWNWVHGCG